MLFENLRFLFHVMVLCPFMHRPLRMEQDAQDATIFDPERMGPKLITPYPFTP